MKYFETQMSWLSEIMHCIANRYDCFELLLNVRKAVPPYILCESNQIVLSDAIVETMLLLLTLHYPLKPCNFF